ncbi:MAG: polyisoprenoid-binding protein [Rhizobiales bacterium]|nr:polyisoprenoid-binding protein [Hyphomicrobiales bacterium]
MKRVLTALALVALLSQPWPQSASGAETTPAPAELPAGAYQLDPAHARLVFRVSHLGMSNYTTGFGRFDAELELDPADPPRSRVTASVDPRSLQLPSPPEGFLATLLGPEWFDAAAFPEITFASTAVEMTGPVTARITGDLTLHGVTLPISLDATFNGGHAGHPMDPGGSRIGFSAEGSLERSAFGMGFGVPAPGATLGVGDLVDFAIETEFTRPKDEKQAQN